MKTLAMALALCCLTTSVSFAADHGPWKCHSQQFTKAKKQLDRMSLTKAQRAAVNVYAQDFRKAWNRSHDKIGCSAHEHHAEEFIAAAAGVLTDDQFKTFKKRARTAVETTRHKLWLTSSYADDLLKLAQR